MGSFGKWIGGGIGWAVGGPIGALVGFAIGTLIDEASVEVVANPHTIHTYRKSATGAGDFALSLLVLSAAVMKADNRVLKTELNYVKDFLLRQFGTSKTKELLPLLKELLKKDIPVEKVCLQIRGNMQHPLRLQLLHYLFGIAKADGKVAEQEVKIIFDIAKHLGISEKDFISIKSMFYKDPVSAYKILEIEPSASDPEVKKAYRTMALKYHPDKVTSLGEEFQTAAKQKFQKVQEAYETIRKERGF